LRAADAHPRLRLDLGAQAGNGPVGPIRDRRLQQRRDHAQRRLTLHRGRAGRHRRLQGRHTIAHEVAAPQPHRVVAHAERPGNAWTDPAGQRQQHRSRPVGFAAIARTRQHRQSCALFFGCRERRFSGHALHLRIGAASESAHQALVKLPEFA
jgi:hypothetical protein